MSDLIQPFPGRLGRTIEICVACALVVTVSMTFQIPSADTSAYLIFFAAKENSGLNVVMSLVFVIVVTVVVGLLFLLAPLALNYPTLRIGIIGLTSFSAFFLTSASKLAPVSGTAGLVVAFGLDLLQEGALGELATRGFLYAWLFVAMPMGVFAAYSLAFGRHPEALLRAGLAARLALCADAIEGAAKPAAVRATVAAGNAALQAELSMVRLFRREASDTVARLAALVPLTYALLLTVSATPEPNRSGLATLPSRLRNLAAGVARLPRVVAARTPAEPPPAAPTLPDQAGSLAEQIEATLDGAPLPKPAKGVAKPKTGFFAPDAFTNPEHSRFALKGSAAVLACYLLFNLLDWPGIHTCLITCFIVALKTLGETLQKMLLRIAGCLAGAASGLAVIVWVLPNTTSITDLAIVIAVATFPAAWIAVGKPSVGYIGFQVAFALFLCVLQGLEPKFDLTLARDRIVGILIGNVVVYVVFTRVFPVSILGAVSQDLGRLLGRCRSVALAAREARPAAAMAGEVAELQAMLGALDAKVAALGLEHRRTPRSRVYAHALRLCDGALGRFVGDLSRFAICPAEPPTHAVAHRRAADIRLEAALRRVAEPMLGPVVVGDTFPTGEARDAEPDMPAAEVEDDPVRVAALEAACISLDRLGVALGRYRRLLSDERAAHA